MIAGQSWLWRGHHCEVLLTPPFRTAKRKKEKKKGQTDSKRSKFWDFDDYISKQTVPPMLRFLAHNSADRAPCDGFALTLNLSLSILANQPKPLLPRDNNIHNTISYGRPPQRRPQMGPIPRPHLLYQKHKTVSPHYKNPSFSFVLAFCNPSPIHETDQLTPMGCKYSDFANGFLIAEIVSKYHPSDVSMHAFDTGTGMKAKKGNWDVLGRVFSVYMVFFCYSFF